MQKKAEIVQYSSFMLLHLVTSMKVQKTWSNICENQTEIFSQSVIPL